MPMIDSTPSPLDLARRIDRLEADLHRLRRRNRRTLAVISSIALASIGLGFATAPTSVDVIRTKRLELLDDTNKVVLLASVTKTGGRLDVWNANGRNSARLGANDIGGDLALWNNTGEQVFAAFASQRSGRLEVGGGSGVAAVTLSSNEQGGIVEVFNLSGRSAVKATCTRQGGEVVAQQFGGNGTSVLGNDAGGGRIEVSSDNRTLAMRGQTIGLHATTGELTAWSIQTSDDGVRMNLADSEGNDRVQLGSTAGGGLAILYNELSNASVIMGSNRGRSGVQIRNTADKLILALGSALDDAGEIQLFNRNGATEVILVAEETAGRLILKDNTNNALVEAGLSENNGGGVLRVFDANHAAAAVLMGLSSGGGSLTVGGPDANARGSFEAPQDGIASIALYGATGRSFAAAAIASGGVISLHSDTNAPALVLGAITPQAGGEISLRNAKGSQILHLGATSSGAGELDVYNSEGSRKRSLSAP
jgi:hypothetical protein